LSRYGIGDRELHAFWRADINVRKSSNRRGLDVGASFNGLLKTRRTDISAAAQAAAAKLTHNACR